MKHKGTLLMVIGGLLVAASIVLLVYNQQADLAAGNTARDTVAPLIETIRQNAALPTPAADTSGEVPPPALPTEMPTVTVDGAAFVGLLEIPEIELSLPIRAECTDEALERSPYLYSGTTYAGDLVIAGHNYDSHFGMLTDLTVGDTVYFTDADGVVSTYAVSAIETLLPTAVEQMCAGEWPLSLFTCTYGGQNRITVRCDLAE